VRKLGIKAPLLGGDGWDSTQLAAIGKEAIEGSYFSNHYSFQEKRPEVENFVSKYEAAHGQKPDGLAALGYDAARLLFDAMNRAPSLDGADAREGDRRDEGLPGRDREDHDRSGEEREEVGGHRADEGRHPRLRDHDPAAAVTVPLIS
jgi:hypothetical protein